MNDPTRDERIDAVTDAIHDMLNGPDGTDQITGGYETETLTVELPAAFFHVAVYLSEAEDDGAGGSLWDALRSGTHKLTDPAIQRALRVFFTNRLMHMMHEDLHLLCNHCHPRFAVDGDHDARVALADHDGPIPF